MYVYAILHLMKRSYILTYKISIRFLIFEMSWIELRQPDHKVMKLLWDFNG